MALGQVNLHLEYIDFDPCLIPHTKISFGMDHKYKGNTLKLIEENTRSGGRQNSLRISTHICANTEQKE